VSKARVFLKYWLPLALWMILIFSASADTRSVQRSRIIEPLLRWLFPHISEEAVSLAVLVARKCAHLTEYAILALLFWRAVRQPAETGRQPWSWRQAGAAVLFVALYAASDELHQSFVPTRDASVRDVFIDTTGAVFGLLLLRAVGGWRKWWQRLPAPPAP
jgi:VanZ family protein